MSIVFIRHTFNFNCCTMGVFPSTARDVEYMNISMYSQNANDAVPHGNAVSMPIDSTFVDAINGNPFTLEHAQGKLPAMGDMARSLPELHQILEKSGYVVGQIEVPFVAPTGTVMGTVRLNQAGRHLIDVGGVTREWLAAMETSLTHVDLPGASISGVIPMPVEAALTDKAARPNCKVLGFLGPFEFAFSVMATNADALNKFMATLSPEDRASLTGALDKSSLRNVMSTWPADQKAQLAAIVGGDSPLVLEVLNAIAADANAASEQAAEAAVPKGAMPTPAPISEPTMMQIPADQFAYVMKKLDEVQARIGMGDSDVSNIPGMRPEQRLAVQCHNLSAFLDKNPQALAATTRTAAEPPAKRSTLNGAAAATAPAQPPNTLKRSDLENLFSRTTFNPMNV